MSAQVPQEKHKVRELCQALGSQDSRREGERGSCGLALVPQHTCADMLTVSTDHWLEGKDCRTLWAMEVFPVPTGPASRMGFWLATRALTR